VRLEDVRRVYSHPQALAQSQGFLDGHRMQAIPVYDTAGAAHDLAERREMDAAAIASERAGELYGLQTLAAAIEDEAFNFTRFLTLARHEAPREVGTPRKTSIVFAVRHRPGALLECLSELRNLNLSRIQSRPRRDRAWSYVFHVDFEGDARDPVAAEALAGLLHRAAFVKVLGSYPAAPLVADD
jgi:prephenate dehydratase